MSTDIQTPAQDSGKQNHAGAAPPPPSSGLCGRLFLPSIFFFNVLLDEGSKSNVILASDGSLLARNLCLDHCLVYIPHPQLADQVLLFESFPLFFSLRFFFSVI